MDKNSEVKDDRSVTTMLTVQHLSQMISKMYNLQKWMNLYVAWAHSEVQKPVVVNIMLSSDMQSLKGSVCCVVFESFLDVNYFWWF